VSGSPNVENPRLPGTIGVRSATPADYPRLLDFWQRHLTPRVAEVFRWRGEAGRISLSHPYLAEQDGQILGAMNTVGVDLRGRGQCTRAVWQTDVVVSPEARGKGVVTRLMEQAAAANAFVLGKGTTAAMYAAKKKFGFRDVPNPNFQACPLTPFYPVGALLRRVKYAAGYAKSRSRRRRSSQPEIRISLASGFSAEFDALDVKLTAGETLSAWKPASYLEWRYLTAPGRSYRVLRADGAEGLRGAIVLRGPEGDERQSWIVDILAEPGDDPTVDALIEAAREMLTRDRAAVVWVFATSSRVRARLTRAGFLETVRSPRFTYFVSGTVPFDPGAVEWNFCDGDGDCELYP
jgi:GNAT superfamily N-acetyltransferase